MGLSQNVKNIVKKHQMSMRKADGTRCGAVDDSALADAVKPQLTHTDHELSVRRAWVHFGCCCAERA